MKRRKIKVRKHDRRHPRNPSIRVPVKEHGRTVLHRSRRRRRTATKGYRKVVIPSRALKAFLNLSMKDRESGVGWNFEPGEEEMKGMIFIEGAESSTETPFRATISLSREKDSLYEIDMDYEVTGHVHPTIKGSIAPVPSDDDIIDMIRNREPNHVLIWHEASGKKRMNLIQIPPEKMEKWRRHSSSRVEGMLRARNPSVTWEIAPLIDESMIEKSKLRALDYRRRTGEAPFVGVPSTRMISAQLTDEFIMGDLSPQDLTRSKRNQAKLRKIRAREGREYLRTQRQKLNDLGITYKNINPNKNLPLHVEVR